jgi:hypothetical protein
MPPRRKPQNEVRRQEAIAAKLKGMPWRGVADLHYNGNFGNCWQDIKDEVEQRRTEIADAAVDYVKEMIERHQAAIVHLTQIAEAVHPLVDNGHVVRDGVGPRDREEIKDLIERNGGKVTSEILDKLMGQPLLDDAAALAARKEIRQHDAELAKLLGLNKPVRVQQEVTFVDYQVVGVDPKDLD